jgi:DnaJ-class molecular chaperone
MKTILAKCSACSGTGLYEGMCEKSGEPVVCLKCGGTGAEKITYTPYTGRVKRSGVKAVYRSRGTFIVSGVGPTGQAMTYAEFCEKHPEPKAVS